MLAMIDMWAHRTELGYFKAESPKPVMLYCNKPFICQIDSYQTTSTLPESSGVALRLEGEDGKVSISGGPNLKASQAYPRDFGIGMRKLYTKHETKVKEDAEKLLSELRASPMDHPMGCALDLLDPVLGAFWDDANLKPVFALLQQMLVQRASAP